MPQATRELQEKWDHDEFMDGKALSHLLPNFSMIGGMIRPRDDKYKPTDDDFSAIDYLCQEWDYGWEVIK